MVEPRGRGRAHQLTTAVKTISLANWRSQWATPLTMKTKTIYKEGAIVVLDVNEFDSMRIGLASQEQILAWSHGGS